jgi:Holliday junction resolvase RusA-like endonuclease
MTTIFPVRLTVLGPPCVWKNQRRVVTKPFVKSHPSKKAAAWMKSAIGQLERQWIYKPIPKLWQLNAKILSYLPTPRLNEEGDIHGWLADADNLYGGPGDALESAGILEDDVCIESHDGSRRLYDKENPRVEMTLTLFDPSLEVQLDVDPSRVDVEF